MKPLVGMRITKNLFHFKILVIILLIQNVASGESHENDGFRSSLSTLKRSRRWINSYADYQRVEQEHKKFNNEFSLWSQYGNTKWAPLPPWPVPAGFNDNLVWHDWLKAYEPRWRYDGNARWLVHRSNPDDKQSMWKIFNEEVKHYTQPKGGWKGWTIAPYPSPLPDDPRDCEIWLDFENRKVIVKANPRPGTVTTPAPAPVFDVTTDIPTTTAVNYDYTTNPPDPGNNEEPH